MVMSQPVAKRGGYCSPCGIWDGVVSVMIFLLVWCVMKGAAVFAAATCLGILAMPAYGENAPE